MNVDLQRNWKQKRSSQMTCIHKDFSVMWFVIPDDPIEWPVFCALDKNSAMGEALEVIRYKVFKKDFDMHFRELDKQDLLRMYNYTVVLGKTRFQEF